MTRVLVQCIKNYDFDNNGERIKMSKVMYITEEMDIEDDVKGHSPLILTVKESEILKELTQVPALYDFDFTMKMGKNNKPELLLKSVEFVAPVSIKSLFI